MACAWDRRANCCQKTDSAKEDSGGSHGEGTWARSVSEEGMEKDTWTVKGLEGKQQLGGPRGHIRQKATQRWQPRKGW
eukprot:11955541-Ditylum_brightwellii.AAC.1